MDERAGPYEGHKRGCACLLRDVQTNLRDILESIEHINDFLGDMDFDAYRNDLKTKSAVERQLQILAEAAIRLIIWDTVKKELPVLKAAVQRVLTPPANQHGPAVK